MSGPYENNGDPGQVEREYVECPKCLGTGVDIQIESWSCAFCDGHGTIEADTDSDEEFNYKFQTSK